MRARLVLGLAQGGLREPVLVEDQDAAALELGQVHLQRRGVHRDQGVGAAAGGQDVPGGEVDLERRDAGQGPRRRPDLGREVGQRHQVVADQGGRRGEAVAGELYAVARIAREADDNPLLFLENLVKSLQKREAFRDRFYAPVWTGSLTDPRCRTRGTASFNDAALGSSAMEGRGEGWKPYVAKVAVLAGAYYGAAKLGLNLAFASSSVTAIWAPTGISLAAVLLWGYRVWPGVALGALLANAWTGVPVLRGAGHHGGEHARGARRRLPAAGAGGFPPLAGAGPGCDRPGDSRGRREHHHQRHDRRHQPAGRQRDRLRRLRLRVAHLVARRHGREPGGRPGDLGRGHPLALQAGARAGAGGRGAGGRGARASAPSSSRTRRRSSSSCFRSGSGRPCGSGSPAPSSGSCWWPASPSR